MLINVPQLLISIPLLFVLFFGLGFILNMILKTTWLPLGIFLGVVCYVFSRVNHLWTFVNFTLFFSGLLGVFVGIWTITWLRKKGYRMF